MADYSQTAKEALAGALLAAAVCAGAVVVALLALPVGESEAQSLLVALAGALCPLLGIAVIVVVRLREVSRLKREQIANAADFGDDPRIPAGTVPPGVRVWPSPGFVLIDLHDAAPSGRSISLAFFGGVAGMFAGVLAGPQIVAWSAAPVLAAALAALAPLRFVFAVLEHDRQAGDLEIRHAEQSVFVVGAEELPSGMLPLSSVKSVSFSPTGERMPDDPSTTCFPVRLNWVGDDDKSHEHVLRYFVDRSSSAERIASWLAQVLGVPVTEGGAPPAPEPNGA